MDPRGLRPPLQRLPAQRVLVMLSSIRRGSFAGADRHAFRRTCRRPGHGGCMQTERDAEVVDWVGPRGSARAEHVMGRFQMGRRWAYRPLLMRWRLAGSRPGHAGTCPAPVACERFRSQRQACDETATARSASHMTSNDGRRHSGNPPRRGTRPRASRVLLPLCNGRSRIASSPAASRGMRAASGRVVRRRRRVRRVLREGRRHDAIEGWAAPF
jgi:hypothetical protein